jgi:hypothetical protein
MYVLYMILRINSDYCLEHSSHPRDHYLHYTLGEQGDIGLTAPVSTADVAYNLKELGEGRC